MRVSLVTCLVALVFALADSGPLQATESDWQENLGGRARLIAAGPIDPQSRSVEVGIEIELKKGWKTYWRNPGDTGIASEFDFSQSTNVESVELFWPAPKAYLEEYGSSIGYTGTVVFPARVVAKRASMPMVVDVRARYGVCEKICVPVDETYSLVLTRFGAEDERAASLISTALASVPQKPDAEDGPRITAVKRVGMAPEGSLTISATLPDGSDQAQLFIEGPEEWYLPLPKQAGRSDTEKNWTVSLADLPTGTDPAGHDVILTLVTPKSAIEQRWRLD